MTRDICPECNGTGEDRHERVCPRCRGMGEVWPDPDPDDEPDPTLDELERMGRE